jgi:hypothetical protein
LPHLKTHSKCERKNGGSLCLVCGSVVRVTDAGAEDRATLESAPSAVAGEYTIDGMTLGPPRADFNGAQPETSQCVCPTCERRKAAKDATKLFKQFLNKLRKLRISLLTGGRRELIASLKSIDKQIKGLLASLEGEE